MSKAAQLTDPRPLARSVARRAAHWAMLMHCGDATPADLDACQRWRAADPEHERAWQRAESLQQKIGSLAPDVAMTTLGRSRRHERRAGLKALLVLMATAPVAHVAWRSDALPDWAADQRTSVGQQRSVTLVDGTLIQLNTDSAIDIQFSQSERLVVLRRGEIMVETGHAAEYASRPFIVATEHGRMRALGTRFVARRDAGSTRIAVQEGGIEIRPVAADTTPRVLRAGQQARFSGNAVEAPVAAGRHVDAWTRGLLFASDMPLGEFVAELGRYQRGLLRCDPGVAQLRISGAFQLSQIDAVLEALPRSLPVNVLYRTRYWVTIVPRAPA